MTLGLHQDYTPFTVGLPVGYLTLCERARMGIYTLAQHTNVTQLLHQHVVCRISQQLMGPLSLPVAETHPLRMNSS